MFEDPTWDWRTFDFDRDVRFADEKVGGVVNAIDPDLRFQLLNERLAEINGLPMADHHGRSVAEVVPDLAHEIEPLLRTVLETREPALGL